MCFLCFLCMCVCLRSYRMQCVFISYRIFHVEVDQFVTFVLCVCVFHFIYFSLIRLHRFIADYDNFILSTFWGTKFFFLSRLADSKIQIYIMIFQRFLRFWNELMEFLSIFVLRLSLGSSMKPWNKENSIAFADIATFYIVLLETQNLIVSLLAVYSGIRNFHSTTLIKIIQAEWFLYRVAFFLPVVRNCVEIVIFFF